MYRVAKTLLCSDADCADAIQEAIVKAFSGCHTLRQDAYAKTWLTRIVINECYAILRREKRLVPLESFVQAETVQESADYSDLYEALGHLPKETRLCVTLYYMEGYSIKEVAGLVKVTESAVKSRLARARAMLKSELEAESEATGL